MSVLCCGSSSVMSLLGAVMSFEIQEKVTVVSPALAFWMFAKSASHACYQVIVCLPAWWVKLHQGWLCLGQDMMKKRHWVWNSVSRGPWWCNTKSGVVLYTPPWKFDQLGLEDLWKITFGSFHYCSIERNLFSIYISLQQVDGWPQTWFSSLHIMFYS